MYIKCITELELQDESGSSGIIIRNFVAREVQIYLLSWPSG